MNHWSQEIKRERESWIEVREGESKSEAQEDEAEKGRVSVLREMNWEYR